MFKKCKDSKNNFVIAAVNSHVKGDPTRILKTCVLGHLTLFRFQSSSCWTRNLTSSVQLKPHRELCLQFFFFFFFNLEVVIVGLLLLHQAESTTPLVPLPTLGSVHNSTHPWPQLRVRELACWVLVWDDCAIMHNSKLHDLLKRAQ
jgi:hypothetical protein